MMPYIKRYVQVIEENTAPNQEVYIVHNLDNTDIIGVDVYSGDPSKPQIAHTWGVIDENQVRIVAAVDLKDSWVVVRAS